MLCYNQPMAGSCLVISTYCMARIEQTDKRKASTAFTLVEVVMSIGILALVMGGMIYGYVQTNHRAEWSSMSLDAQSFATEAIEQVRAAQLALGGGTAINQLLQLPFSNGTYTRTNTMLIPSTGRLTNVVTTVTISPTFAIATRPCTSSELTAFGISRAEQTSSPTP